MPLRALAIRHVPFENLGVWEEVLAGRGYRIDYRDAGIDALDPGDVAAADLAVVLGGPIGVYETEAYPFLAGESAALAARLRGGGPTLGVCLGAQLLARVLGAEVAGTGRTEIGYAPLALTAAGRDSVLAPLDGVPVLHWHGDQFAVPASAERLAFTPGWPNQAFRAGPRVLGLQFHLEADPAQIERWLIGHAHELAAEGIDPRTVRADAAEHGPALAKAAVEVLERWLDEAAAATEPPAPA